MNLKVYAIYDSKSEAYSKPHLELTRGLALRSWDSIVNDPNSSINKHPEDFTLFELGEYDPTSGQFQNHSTPLSLGVAIETHKRYEEAAK